MKLHALLLAVFVSLTSTYLFCADLDDIFIKTDSIVLDESKIFISSFREMTVNTKGQIYIADKKRERILKFDKNGKFIKTLGNYGNGPGEFFNLRVIGVDYRDNVYGISGNKS